MSNNILITNEAKFIELGAFTLINVNEISYTRPSLTQKGFDILLKNGAEFHSDSEEIYLIIKQLITWL